MYISAFPKSMNKLFLKRHEVFLPSDMTSTFGRQSKKSFAILKEEKPVWTFGDCTNPFMFLPARSQLSGGFLEEKKGLSSLNIVHRQLN